MPTYNRILLIDNYDSFTYNLVDYFRQAGAEVQVYRNRVSIEVLKEIDFDLLVLSPGPGRPEEAGNLMRIIEAFHETKPIFGVCLGMQALVEFFGGTLKYLEPCHGKSDQIFHERAGVFSGIESPMTIGRYHSLAAEKLPGVLESTSRTKDQVIMGVRHKYLPIEGVQFHPESILSAHKKAGYKLIENVVEGKLSTGNVGYFQLMKRLQDQAHIQTADFNSFVEQMASGQLTEDQKLILLVSLSFRLKQPIFLHGFIQSLLTCGNAEGLRKYQNDFIDICGTGGSGLPRLNTSTIASFLLSGFGLPIAKHGNRAASGRFGSFDLLEGLGVPIEMNQKEIQNQLKTKNLAFLFAPNLHPVVGQFGTSRAKMGVPTIFNVMGPLLNPLQPKRQFIGTAFEQYMDLILEAGILLGREHLLVVRGGEGLDEVSVSKPTKVLSYKFGQRNQREIEPKHFGINPIPFKEVAVHQPKANLGLAEEILSGSFKTKHYALVAANAALVYTEFMENIPLNQAYDKMVEGLKSGIGMKALEAHRNQERLAL